MLKIIYIVKVVVNFLIFIPITISNAAKTQDWKVFFLILRKFKLNSFSKSFIYKNLKCVVKTTNLIQKNHYLAIP